jgi:hypothetical protein
VDARPHKERPAVPTERDHGRPRATALRHGAGRVSPRGLNGPKTTIGETGAAGQTGNAKAAAILFARQDYDACDGFLTPPEGNGAAGERT